MSVITDSQVCFYIIARGRSGAARLWRLCRRVSAVVLAGNFKLVPMWVGSKDNHADASFEIDILRPGARPLLGYGNTNMPFLNYFSRALYRPQQEHDEVLFNYNHFEFHPPAMTAGKLQQDHSRDHLVPEVRDVSPSDHTNAYSAGSYVPASKAHLVHTILLFPSLSFD